MKNSLFIALFTSLAMYTGAQDKYANTFVCQKGKIHFFSSSPLEDIEATSKSTVCVLNTQSKKVYAKTAITGFDFKDKLMQEHFNENYLESDQFPSAVLDMVIADDIDFTKDGVYDVTLKGSLEIHGVKQDREIKGKLTVANGVPVRATADFVVKLVDHKIKVPKAVVMNIAETIRADVDFTFKNIKNNNIVFLIHHIHRAV